MTTYFISDALASRMQSTSNINSNLGMERNIPRGAELEDQALLDLLAVDIRSMLCSELNIVDKNSFYIISNFVTLSERAKNELAKLGNYIIFEHDHKYVTTRNPFSHSSDGIVPPDKRINTYFYKAAKKVICITDWHEKQVKLNTESNTTNIHGGIWTYKELDLFENYLRQREDPTKYAIFWSQFKNPDEAIRYASKNRLEYRILRQISNRDQFLKILSTHKGLIFFPIIPETGSRLIIESKMLGLDVITNKNSGAANEYWFDKNGLELIDLFRNKILPDIKNTFKELICAG